MLAALAISALVALRITVLLIRVMLSATRLAFKVILAVVALSMIFVLSMPRMIGV